jgi:hypothetical protein
MHISRLKADLLRPIVNDPNESEVTKILASCGDEDQSIHKKGWHSWLLRCDI